MLAERFDATVHSLSVVDTRKRLETPASGFSAQAWTEAERERAQHAIEDTVAELPDDIPVETELVEGVPMTTILEYVDDAAMDMVVMGTHGWTGLDRYRIGSVAENVVRRSPVPVVTVRLTDV